MTKLKIESYIFKSSNNFIFYNFFNNFFIMLFFIYIYIYIKISKNLSAKCYQKNKESPQKKARERFQNLSKEEKQEKSTIWLWALQTYLRRWKNNLVEYGKKNIIKWEKRSFYNYWKLFQQIMSLKVLFMKNVTMF